MVHFSRAQVGHFWRALKVFEELITQAAQADVLHNDDTTMKVLDLSKEQLAAAAAGAEEVRTGVYTSGLIATQGERAIALFFTGQKHAGENLEEVLKRRAETSRPFWPTA